MDSPRARFQVIFTGLRYCHERAHLSPMSLLDPRPYGLLVQYPDGMKPGPIGWHGLLAGLSAVLASP